MKKIHSSETLLLVTIVLAVLLTANAILGFVLTGQSSSAMKVLLQTRMLDVANTAADMLNGDKLKALKAEDKGTPNYQQVNDTLAYFRDNIDLEYIYCIQPKGEKEFVFSVDPTITDPGEFGAPIVYTDALYMASQGTAAVDEEPYSDAWGRFYSAYSPVFGSDGKVAGIVAVDFSAKWYEEEIARQTRTIYICMAISSGVCVLLLILGTSRLRRRIRDMTQDLADLAQDVDDITWEMADMEASDELRQSLHDESANLSNLNERLRSVKDGLRRYREDSRSKANIITTALSSDYRNVCYLNLDTDKAICYKTLDNDCGMVTGEEFSFTETMKEYARLHVAKEDQAGFLQFLNLEDIRWAMKGQNLITHNYRLRREELEFYATVRIAAIKHPDNPIGYGVHAVGIGFADMDWKTSQALSQSRQPEN